MVDLSCSQGGAASKPARSRTHSPGRVPSGPGTNTLVHIAYNVLMHAYMYLCMPICTYACLYVLMHAYMTRCEHSRLAGCTQLRVSSSRHHLWIRSDGGTKPESSCKMPPLEHTCIHAYMHTYIHTYIHTYTPSQSPHVHATARTLNLSRCRPAIVPHRLASTDPLHISTRSHPNSTS